MAKMRVKEGESSRDMRPCPQPRSKRKFLGPRWYASMVEKTLGG